MTLSSTVKEGSTMPDGGLTGRSRCNWLDFAALRCWHRLRSSQHREEHRVVADLLGKAEDAHRPNPVWMKAPDASTLAAATTMGSHSASFTRAGLPSHNLLSSAWSQRPSCPSRCSRARTARFSGSVAIKTDLVIDDRRRDLSAQGDLNEAAGAAADGQPANS